MASSDEKHDRHILIRSIDDNLYRELRKVCIDKGVPAQQVLREILNGGMAAWLERAR